MTFPFQSVDFSNLTKQFCTQYVYRFKKILGLIKIDILDCWHSDNLSRHLDPIPITIYLKALRQQHDANEIKQNQIVI
jgi:hypothetical protein